MSNYQIQLILPDEVIENLPSDPGQWVSYLVKFFEATVLKTYENSLQQRQRGTVMGVELSRYEKTAYLDLLIDIALGQLREKIEVSGHNHRDVSYVADKTA